VHEELKVGLNDLATVVCVAPLLGLFGTIDCIANTFRGIDGERYTIMAAIAGSISRALVPTAIGLLVGLISLWCHRLLTAQLERVDGEMDGAQVALVNQLVRYRGRWVLGQVPERLAVFSTSFGALGRSRQLSELAAATLIPLGAIFILCWCLLRFIWR
jgi:hypothetical protein